ncbi:cysteine hydrolase family protein [Haloferula sargassicola]|uniref:Isochorismatase-like domain-containing protein n=1 Tax=Haloferula sargassicola TaxID=490096 RepID=A0ABP9UMS7_9BACT
MDPTEPRLSTSALLTIDMQNDFVLPGAPGCVAGTSEVVSQVSELVGVWRRAALPVIHVVRLYLPDGSNADLCRRARLAAGASIVRPATSGAELVTPLKIDPAQTLDPELLLSGKAQRLAEDEFVVYKPRWGAFFRTVLEDLLATLAVDTLVVCGCNFPNCPRATLYQASERDFRLIAVTDALSRLGPRDHADLTGIGIRLRSVSELEREMAPPSI